MGDSRRTCLVAAISLTWLSTVGFAGHASEMPATAAQDASQTLPGGATELQERHGDWRVTCAQPTGKRVCTLSQQQSDRNTRQLVIAIELKAPSANQAEGTIVLPFGLAVDRPVTLQIDDAPGVQRPVRTCLPVGCLVPVTFDGAMVTALSSGTILSVRASAVDGTKETVFRIPLAGFASALARTAALAK